MLSGTSFKIPSIQITLFKNLYFTIHYGLMSQLIEFYRIKIKPSVSHLNVLATTTTKKHYLTLKIVDTILT